MPELTTKQWQDRIKDGQRFQLEFAKSADWPRYKAFYRHDFGSNKGVIPVNLYFSLLRSMVPQVYFKNPKVTITARKPGLEAELNARIVQTLDNWLLGELMTKQEIKLMIQDSFLAGTASGIIGYDSQFGFSSSLAETRQFSLSQFDKKGNAIEFANQVSPGMPWFLRARPEDVVWPWGCQSSKTAEWFALRVFRQLDDIKADRKYSNTSGLTGTHQPVRTNPEGGQVIDNINPIVDTTDNKYIELWEVHDARTGKVYALVMDHDKLLRKDNDELQIDGLPVETLSFNPDSDFIYGIPDARIIEPQQLELNEIRTQAMKHRRVDILKGLIAEGAMTDEEIEKLTDENVMAFAKVSSDQGDIRTAVTTLNSGAGAILQDMALAGEQVRADVREMVGFSRIAQGEFQGKTHISATETKAVFSSLNIRLDERRDMVADLLTNVIRKFNQIIFTYWDQERVAQVVGPDGAKWWLKFNGQQIKDEYDMTVAPEEGPNLDSGTKFEMGLKAAETWAKLNAGQIAQGAPIPMEIQRLLFNQFQGTGLDIDRLMAQAQAGAQQTQLQAQLGQSGQSPDQAISPGQLAQAGGGQ